jgi:hypothetical protein
MKTSNSLDRKNYKAPQQGINGIKTPIIRDHWQPMKC